MAVLRPFQSFGQEITEGRHRGNRDFGLGMLFHAAQKPLFARLDDGHRRAFSSGPACPPNTVDIDLQ